MKEEFPTIEKQNPPIGKITNFEAKYDLVPGNFMKYLVMIKIEQLYKDMRQKMARDKNTEQTKKTYDEILQFFEKMLNSYKNEIL